MLVKQHYNFLFEPVASHGSAYCYDLFQTIWNLAIKRCKMNLNSNIQFLHKLVIGDWTFSKNKKK